MQFSELIDKRRSTRRFTDRKVENDTLRRIMEQAEWTILPRAVSLFCQGRLKVEGRTVRILKPLHLSKECLQ